MTENHPYERAFERRLGEELHRVAASVTASPGPATGIVARSRRRRARQRAAGALAGACGLVVGGLAVTRPSDDVDVTSAAAGGVEGTTTSVGSVPAGAPGTTGVATTVPRLGGGDPTPPLSSPDPGPAIDPPDLVPLVPDPNPIGILSSTLRIEVEPDRLLRDGQEVVVRGSGFPAGERVGFALCTTHGAMAATLAAGAGWCDTASGADLGLTTSPVVAPDGTFEATYRVRRTLVTLGGPVDCAAGTVDADEARALQEQGLLGPASYPEGAWGCALVAVRTRQVPRDGGVSVTEYVEATARVVQFDPTP